MSDHGPEAINPHKHALKVIADHLGISSRGEPQTIADEVIAEFQRIDAERQRDAERAQAALSRAIGERDAQVKLTDDLGARVAELEARHEFRFVALLSQPHLGFVKSLGAHEPGFYNLPEGWEWDGRWHPAGLDINSEGVTVNCWQRNVRRVAPR